MLLKISDLLDYDFFKCYSEFRDFKKKIQFRDEKQNNTNSVGDRWTGELQQKKGATLSDRTFLIV